MSTPKLNKKLDFFKYIFVNFDSMIKLTTEALKKLKDAQDKLVEFHVSKSNINLPIDIIDLTKIKCNVCGKVIFWDYFKHECG